VWSFKKLINGLKKEEIWKTSNKKPQRKEATNEKLK